MIPLIDLGRRGPSEQEWAAVCDELAAFVWPACSRVVVVSPHPDDETLGAGALICSAVERGLPVLVVSVTDGEAAAPSPDLAEIRTAELDRALRCLDPHGSIRVDRLGFADSRVGSAIDALTDSIAAHLRVGDLVACPLPNDGHPDHPATSTAATAAARSVGGPCAGFRCGHGIATTQTNR